MNIPLSKPSIKQSDIENVLDVLNSGMLVQGKVVERFEQAVAKFVGAKHAVAVSNGTASLHLALLSLDVGVGDEVIVPAFSYVATANAVELVGATPIFVDISLKDYNIDVSLIEAAITNKTKAIIPVHEFGQPADMAVINCIAKKYNIRVIEDAACALGSEFGEQKIGILGDVGSFSFHPRKSITSGEGGILTTNDDYLCNFYRTNRNHGIQKINNKIEFVSAGFNYRMTDIQAALVMGQMERIQEIKNARVKFAEKYNENLCFDWLIKPAFSELGQSSWQSYHVLLKEGLDRDFFFTFLRNKGIEVNYGAQCIPTQKYFGEKYGFTNASFPNAYFAYTRGVVLPLFDSMTKEEFQYVIHTLSEFEELIND